MKYDVAIIGGGPAGLIAAGRAAELGARVIILEKNPELGRKLLITGNGRCNLTNDTDDPKRMIEKYGKNGKFLYSCMYRFGVGQTKQFFIDLGLPLKCEDNGRIFPASEKSRDVLKVLARWLDSLGVEIRTATEVRGFIQEERNIKKVILPYGEKIEARQHIVCTGGKTYVQTGSTGDGYKWLKKFGHSVSRLYPILTPVDVLEPFIKEMEGSCVHNAVYSIFVDNRKLCSQGGDAVFTSQGLSGPAILDISRCIGPDREKESILEIDFFPDLDRSELDRRFQQEFSRSGNKMLKNVLDIFLTPKIIPVILRLASIPKDAKANSITREQRIALLELLKRFKLNVKDDADFARAMATAGGVDPKQIDPGTMRSRLIDNLFIAGEILDVDGPTGGYNLQICWSTGYIAGENAAHRI